MKNPFPIVVSVICLCLAPSLVQAAVSPANSNESASAFQALDALAQKTRAKGDLPRWSHPDHAKVLARFWDVNATLGTAPYTSADVPALLDAGDRAVALYKTYLLLPPQAGALPDTAANTAKYQDEIARAAAYVLHVQVAQLEAMTDFVRTLPAADMTATRKAGLQQMRLGFNEQISGLILMLRSPGLHPDNRAIVLDALAAGATGIAMSMPPADRAATVAQIQTVLPVLTDAERAKALAVQSAFQSKECSGLCAVDGQ